MASQILKNKLKKKPITHHYPGSGLLLSALYSYATPPETVYPYRHDQFLVDRVDSELKKKKIMHLTSKPIPDPEEPLL